MKRLNVAISDEAGEKLNQLQQKNKISSRDTTIDLLIKKFDPEVLLQDD